MRLTSIIFCIFLLTGCAGLYTFKADSLEDKERMEADIAKQSSNTRDYANKIYNDKSNLHHIGDLLVIQTYDNPNNLTTLFNDFYRYCEAKGGVITNGDEKRDGTGFYICQKDNNIIFGVSNYNHCQRSVKDLNVSKYMCLLTVNTEDFYKNYYIEQAKKVEYDKQKQAEKIASARQYIDNTIIFDKKTKTGTIGRNKENIVVHQYNKFFYSIKNSTNKPINVPLNKLVGTYFSPKNEEYSIVYDPKSAKILKIGCAIVENDAVVVNPQSNCLIEFSSINIPGITEGLGEDKKMNGGYIINIFGKYPLVLSSNYDIKMLISDNYYENLYEQTLQDR